MAKTVCVNDEMKKKKEMKRKANDTGIKKRRPVLAELGPWMGKGTRMRRGENRELLPLWGPLSVQGSALELTSAMPSVKPQKLLVSTGSLSLGSDNKRWARPPARQRHLECLILCKKHQVFVKMLMAVWDDRLMRAECVCLDTQRSVHSETQSTDPCLSHVQSSPPSRCRGPR